MRYNKFPAAEKYSGMLEYFFAAGIRIDQKLEISFGKELQKEMGANKDTHSSLFEGTHTNK